jgi:hypothetical protein
MDCHVEQVADGDRRLSTDDNLYRENGFVASKKMVTDNAENLLFRSVGHRMAHRIYFKHGDR